MTYIANKRGNSPAAIAGRVGARVRSLNKWKVRTGLWTRQELTRFAREMERAARAAPWEFAHWAGIIR